MKPRLSVLTLTVRDLEKSVAFYRDGLGWKTEGIIGQDFENGAVAFFELQGGLKLALWPQEFLRNESGLRDNSPNNPTSFSLGHNVNAKREVDAVFALAKKAGAKILKLPTDKVWGGYSGYFQDPDGHIWEVAWNPEWNVED